jgi:2'-5' RNA ligase
VAADGPISGFVGLVLLPDEETIGAARRVARAVLAEGAESALGDDSLPHVTLTQCALREAPRPRILDLALRLNGRLRGLRIPLGPLLVFGGGFVFWCVEPDSPERATLQAAHEDALALADGVLDPAANAAVVEATGRLTGDDPVLVANARRHGYAFVGDRYLPHVTLGFDSRLATMATALEPRAHPHAMRVERVALARLARYGVAESVISL